MAGAETTVERLRHFLRELSPGARSLLIGELERSVLRGEDAALGKQEDFYWKYETYLKLAEAFGIPATKASTPAEVDEAIRFARDVDGPALIWFEIAEEQNIFPMMPAGKGLSDLIEKWDGADE